MYCAGGSRSAFAARTLEELGYENVASLAGGFTDWKRNGFPFELPQTLDEAKRRRYSRHLLIPEVGEEGQQKLLDSRVLLIGAAGLARRLGSTSQPPASGRSASSTTTPSTRRTSSARSHSTERLGAT